MRYAPDGRSNCDWRNELKIALDCEEAVTALLHKREEPLEFLHDTRKLLPGCAAWARPMTVAAPGLVVLSQP
jgi:hypothetical protein